MLDFTDFHRITLLHLWTNPSVNLWYKSHLVSALCQVNMINYILFENCHLPQLFLSTHQCWCTISPYYMQHCISFPWTTKTNELFNFGSFIRYQIGSTTICMWGNRTWKCELCVFLVQQLCTLSDMSSLFQQQHANDVSFIWKNKATYSKCMDLTPWVNMHLYLSTNFDYLLRRVKHWLHWCFPQMAHQEETGESPSRSAVAPFGLRQSGFQVVLQMIVSNQLGCIITSQINILTGQGTLKLGIVHCVACAFDSGIELQARLPAYIMSRVYCGGSLTQSHIPTLGIRVPPQGCDQVCCNQRHPIHSHGRSNSSS